MPAYNKKKSFIRAILCALHIAAFGLISLSASLSNAQSEIEAEPKQYVKIRLLAEKSQIAAGEEIWIGIEQSIAPHWHTYWQNPGDSGSSAKVDWDLPEGFNIGEIIWPTPKKIPYGPLANYGYENNVVLLQKLKAPHTLPEGPIALSADIELLVCKEICIPEFGTYELTLNDPSALDEDNAAFFEVAHAQLPQVMDWDASYTEHENMFNLRLHIQDQDLLARMEGQDIALYPLNWGILNNPADNTATVNIEDQTLIISQPRGDRALAAIDSFRSVIDFTSQDGARHSYRFTAAQEGSLVASNDAAETQSDAVSEEAYTNTNTKNAHLAASNTTLLIALWSALLGGLILNLMPCVFPVLSIKALSLVKIAEKNRP